MEVLFSPFHFAATSTISFLFPRSFFPLQVQCPLFLHHSLLNFTSGIVSTYIYSQIPSTLFFSLTLPSLFYFSSPKQHGKWLIKGKTMLLTGCTKMKGGVTKRVVKAGQKGPRLLVVSKFCACHLRFRPIFYYHLSTSCGLSTRQDTLDDYHLMLTATS